MIRPFFSAIRPDQLLSEKLKDAHCSVAANQRALDILKAHKVQGGFGFVLGHNEESDEDLLAIYDFVTGGRI